MRALAEKESDPALKRKLLDLADQYDKLMARAARRSGNDELPVTGRWTRT